MKRIPVHSMTGFSSVEGTVSGKKLRLEIKALNHRFLDIKIRVPRDIANAEAPLRAAVQAHFSRGAIEAKLERVAGVDEPSVEVHADAALALRYFQAIEKIKKKLNLNDSIRLCDVIAFPDVISRTGVESSPEAWEEIEPLTQAALQKLTEMRAHEGETLTKGLLECITEMEATQIFFRKRREECQTDYRHKITEKVQSIFAAYPIAESSIKAVLESRVAQELALVLDRTDIEEELKRFEGHISHFRKILEAGGPVGRKLDFILQEMNREVNTLGNKAQDFSISEQVVQTKVRLEQLREQVMNLE